MSNELSRRQFLAGATAFALGGAVFGLPRRAFADDAQAGSAIVILHTNDVHCAVGEAEKRERRRWGIRLWQVTLLTVKAFSAMGMSRLWMPAMPCRATSWAR